MINGDILNKNIKNKKISNSYILCGIDEELIKESINNIIKPFVSNDGMDLNYIKMDGLTTDFDSIKNACETMPFFSDKKVVVIYRANFLKEKCDSEGKKLFSEIKEYLKDISETTILIMYYVFNDKRENPKKNKKLMSLDKITNIVHIEKLKREGFVKKVSEIFKIQKAEIGNMEVRYFCEKVPSNLDIVKYEIDKLISYANGRKIKKEDIDKLLPRKSEDDIFDLVDLISQRKIEKAMDMLDELLFKADQHMLIITSIEKQFKTLYDVKAYLNEGKSSSDLEKILRRPKFVCDKLSNLSKKFTRKQLEGLLRICLDTENVLKSSTVDKKTELEFLLIKTLMVKK